MRIYFYFLIILFVSSTVLIAVTSYCAFNEQLAISTKAISLANAVTANPPSLMAIHYNPAGLSLLKPGKWFSQGLTIPYIKKTSKFDRDPKWPGIFGGFKDDPILDKNGHAQGTNTGGKMFIPIINQPINFLIAPTLGIAYKRPGSKWTFAFGNYPPFAVGLIHGDKDDPARWGGWEVYQQHLIYAAPAVSYQIRDNLSIGLSVGIGQTALGARVDMRNPNELVSLTKILGNATKDLEIPVISELTLPPPWFGGGVGPYDKLASLKIRLRDDFSPNYNVGILWSPFKWLTFGLCYQSPIKVQLRGKYIIKYSRQWQKMMDWFGSSPMLLEISGMLDLPTKGVPSQRGRVTTNIEFPQRIQAGVKLSLFDRLNLMFDVKWANWSVIEQDNFRFDQSIQLFKVAKMSGYTGGNYNLILKRDFRDTLDWAVGIEYLLNKKITLRAGYEWRKSPVRKRLFDLLYALPDMHFFGAGVSIKLPKEITLDLGGAYLFNKGFKVPDNSSKNLNSNVFTDIVYNPYAGLDYEQDTETYMLSASVTMPFNTMKELMHHQSEIFKKAVSNIMFFKHKKKEEKEIYIERLNNISRYEQNSTTPIPKEKIEDHGLVVNIPEDILKPEKKIKRLIKKWINYWQKADIEHFISFYAPYSIKSNLFGRDAIYNYYKKLWSKNRPKKIIIRDLNIWKVKRGYKAQFIQEYKSQNGYKDIGITTLLLEDVLGNYKIVYQQWERQNIEVSNGQKIQLNFVKREGIKQQLIDFISKWKKAYLSHDLNKFISFYAPYAIKGKIVGKSRILNYYKRLWTKDIPKKIYIANLDVHKTNRGYTISFIQKYESLREYRYIGIVRMMLEKSSSGLLIINQQWTPMHDADMKKFYDTLIEWINLYNKKSVSKIYSYYSKFIIKNNKIVIKNIKQLIKEDFEHLGNPLDVKYIMFQKHRQKFNVQLIVEYKKETKLSSHQISMIWKRLGKSWKIIVEETN